jgi:hypothetical protein
MQLRFSFFFLTLLGLAQIELKALDAIDHNKQYIYVMDKGQVNRYAIGVYDEKGKYAIHSDTNFINRFYNDFAKPFCKDKMLIKKKLGAAFYTNLTCFNDKVFIAAQYSSFTPDVSGSEFVIVEYNADMQFQNCYVLKNPGDFRSGRVSIYPRFKMQYSDKNLVLLNVVVPNENKLKDSIYALAAYVMDQKKCELRFKNLIAIPNTIKTLQGVCVFNNPRPAKCFPAHMPLNFAQHPVTISFPYLIFRNWNKHKIFDPFHHFQYAIDSVYTLPTSIGPVSVGTFYNFLRTRELPLACDFENDTLQMVLRNYASNDQQLVLLTMVKDEYKIKVLKTTNNDFDDAYFHIVGGKVVEVRKYTEGFDLKALE